MKKLLLIAVLAVALVTDPFYYLLGPALDPVNYPAQISFPEKFFWGVSSAAHQTEGHQTNDWTVWEKNNAQRLANNYRDCSKNQGIFCAEKTDPANYISGSAADHYQQYQEDISLAKQLKLNAYRFSLEWSRIEPKPGEFDQAVIDHYRQEIRQAREAGMEPFVNIWHWTNPLWFTEQGGWCQNQSIDQFNRYAKKVIEEYGNEVNYWITLNEPQVYVTMPYVDRRPPGINPLCSYQILNNLTVAHKQTYQAIKTNWPSSQVGITTGSLFFESSVSDTLSRAQQGSARFWNSYLLKQINGYQDFIGLNYFHGGLTYGYKKNSDYVSDIGWPLYPEGLYYILKDLGQFDKPIIITENGLAPLLEEVMQLKK